MLQPKYNVYVMLQEFSALTGIVILFSFVCFWFGVFVCFDTSYCILRDFDNCITWIIATLSLISIFFFLQKLFKVVQNILVSLFNKYNRRNVITILNHNGILVAKDFRMYWKRRPKQETNGKTLILFKRQMPLPSCVRFRFFR